MSILRLIDCEKRSERVWINDNVCEKAKTCNDTSCKYNHPEISKHKATIIFD